MTLEIGIVDDDKAVRDSLSALLRRERNLHLAFVVGSAEEALAEVERLPPELLIVDLGLPGMNGVQLIERLAVMSPRTEVLVLTIYEDDQSVFEALRAGAVGYLTKDSAPEQLLDAVGEVHRGGAPMSPSVARRVVQAFAARPPAAAAEEHWCTLTPREREILEQLARGYTYQNVASTLQLSTHTVHSHVRNIYKKLAVNSRSEAVYQAVRRGLVRIG